MAYIQYAESPDIFEKETGKRLTEQEASTAGLFTTTPGQLQNVEISQQVKPETSTIKLPEISNEFTSDVLTQTPKTKFDIDALLEENRQMREKYLKTIAPTTSEIDIGKQLTDLRTQAGQERIATQQESERLATPEGARTMGLLRGQRAKLATQAELKQQTLISQEKNLLSRLGLEQESRRAEGEILKTGMGFIAQDIEIQQKIQERLNAEEDKILARANTLRDDARAVLSTILTKFSGMDISELSPQIQQQLAITATKAGIPLDILISGMKSVKDQQDFSNSMKMAEFGLKEQGAAEKLDIARERLEMAKTEKGKTETPSVSDENGQRITVLDSTSSSYINDLFNSNVGGKKVTQVELLRPLQKALTVSSQLGELSTLVKTTNTDPIIGTLRSMNPYDFDARAIQATLQAIVPNLARGVYGEVGVLTDNDIKNYIQTLPNIKSTEQQNKFVMGMTLRSLQSGLLAQLEVLQAGGYDLSGFRNSYDKMARQANDIEEDLGIGKEVGTQDISNEEFLKNIPTFGPPTPAQTDNKSFFGGIYNWLTGK